MCCKDLRLLAELGESSGTQLDMTKAAQKKFELARQTYGDDAPELMVAKLVEEASDVSLQVVGVSIGKFNDSRFFNILRRQS